MVTRLALVGCVVLAACGGEHEGMPDGGSSGDASGAVDAGGCATRWNAWSSLSGPFPDSFEASVRDGAASLAIHADPDGYAELNVELLSTLAGDFEVVVPFHDVRCGADEAGIRVSVGSATAGIDCVGDAPGSMWASAFQSTETLTTATSGRMIFRSITTPGGLHHLDVTIEPASGEPAIDVGALHSAEVTAAHLRIQVKNWDVVTTRPTSFTIDDVTITGGGNEPASDPFDCPSITALSQ